MSCPHCVTGCLYEERELDVLIAEKVMGWTEIEPDDRDAFIGIEPREGACFWAVPYYSTDIAAAWQVVDKLKHFTLRRKGDSWTVEYRDCQNPMDHMVVNDCCASMTAETAPLAICLAALRSVGHSL